MGAEKTYIPDPDGAKDGLVRMGHRAAGLKGEIDKIVGDIKQMEGGKPWGTSDTVKDFTKLYDGDGKATGAKAVHDNVDGITKFAHDYAQGGFVAISASVDTDDENGKGLKST